MAVREQNPFDTPVPGQSLTDTPGNYPWEHSPQFATVEDASHSIWNGIHEEDTMEKILVLLDAGLTVEEIVKVIVFAGFVEGKFNPDVGLLLVAMGKKAGIEKIKLEKPKENTTEQLIETVLEQKPDNMKDEPKEEKKMSKGLMSKKEEENK